MFTRRNRTKQAQPTTAANVKKLIEGFDGLGKCRVLAQKGLVVLVADLEDMAAKGAPDLQVVTVRVFRLNPTSFWCSEGYIGDCLANLHREAVEESQFIAAAKAMLTVFSKE